MRRRKPKGKRSDEPIGTLDFETDPFLSGRIPHPFACGIYFGENDYAILWASDSKRDFIDRCVSALRRLPKCTLYAHNGGRFDFHYLLEYAEKSGIEIRNGRVTKMQIGQVTLKDSFPLMPFALEEFRKTPIDYALFEADKRERHRKEIEAYLLDDCRDLLALVVGFRAIVGERDTIGSAAFLQMRALGIDIVHMNETHDEMFRPFYFGGRVEAFKKGVFHGSFKYLDINSAYPLAMCSSHAHGGDYKHGRTLPRGETLGPCFVRCIATSNGALPIRTAEGNLSFPHGTHEFSVTGWEIAAGIATRTLTIDKVLDVWKPQSFINFREYVEKFYALRTMAKNTGDGIKRLAYKYLLNSGYGKFAQNPRDFREYRLAKYGQNVPGYDWETDFGDISLWSKSSYRGFGFFDVATGASITGFVRAMLWKAICKSKGVLYADTDSLICQSTALPMGNKLGEWKMEHAPHVRVTEARIAGKKLYGVKWSHPDAHGNRTRIASKGARLTWGDMLDLCKGNTVEWENEAPTFAITGAHFIKRNINAT